MVHRHGAPPSGMADRGSSSPRGTELDADRRQTTQQGRSVTMIRGVVSFRYRGDSAVARYRRTARAVGKLWNWKSAVVSAIGRSSIFLVVNLPAGVAAALAASRTEFAYRLFAAGFYGALTAWFARKYPSRAGTIAALVVVP